MGRVLAKLCIHNNDTAAAAADYLNWTQIFIPWVKYIVDRLHMDLLCFQGLVDIGSECSFISDELEF